MSISVTSLKPATRVRTSTVARRRLPQEGELTGRGASQSVPLVNVVRSAQGYAFTTSSWADYNNSNQHGKMGRNRLGLNCLFTWSAADKI
jgi:hypothetical protein